MVAKSIVAGVLALLAIGAAHPASAQQIAGARVVTACGSVSPFPPIHPGGSAGLYVDPTGVLCTTGGGGGGSNASVGPIGSTAPGSATLIGGVTAGGLLQAPIITATQSLKVANSDTESSVGTPIGSALTVQGNALGIPFPVTPKTGVFSIAGCTVGTSSAQCLASGSYNHVQIQNASASASIACAWGTAAVLNGATSVQLASGQPALWGPATSGVPTGALNCIASAASTPLYMESN